MFTFCKNKSVKCCKFVELCERWIIDDVGACYGVEA